MNSVNLQHAILAYSVDMTSQLVLVDDDDASQNNSMHTNLGLVIFMQCVILNLFMPTEKVKCKWVVDLMRFSPNCP